MKRLLLSLFIILFSRCQKEPSEYIILTRGMGMDPNSPRIGIELRNDTLYYCEEVIKDGKRGEYNYYIGQYDPQQFLRIKEKVDSHFKVPNHYEAIVDSKDYELIHNFFGSADTLKFSFPLLNDRQIETIFQIEVLKNSKLKQADYHKFPESLLKYRLPEPPPLDKKSPSF